MTPAHMAQGRAHSLPSATGRQVGVDFLPCLRCRCAYSWYDGFMSVRQRNDAATVRRRYLPHTFRCSPDLGSVSDVVVPRTSPEHKIFSYENMYRSLIDKKKGDGSYRYFRSIVRLQNQFPLAQCSRTGKKVNVWCSNDYVSTVTTDNLFYCTLP